jgi:hypothetical protein
MTKTHILWFYNDLHSPTNTQQLAVHFCDFSMICYEFLKLRTHSSSAERWPKTRGSSSQTRGSLQCKTRSSNTRNARLVASKREGQIPKTRGSSSVKREGQIPQTRSSFIWTRGSFAIVSNTEVLCAKSPPLIHTWKRFFELSCNAEFPGGFFAKPPRLVTSWQARGPTAMIAAGPHAVSWRPGLPRGRPGSPCPGRTRSLSRSYTGPTWGGLGWFWAGLPICGDPPPFLFE